MTNKQTAEAGIQAICDELAKRGARDIRVWKEGNRQKIGFLSKNGGQYVVAPRSKRSGTWQTTIAYGKRGGENPVEREYWIFVDIGIEPHIFYTVPTWWIANDIYEVHQGYLKTHGGHRRFNDDSNHHGIPVKRIAAWEGRWEQLGL